jgi:hypothetical protein
MAGLLRGIGHGAVVVCLALVAVIGPVAGPGAGAATRQLPAVSVVAGTVHVTLSWASGAPSFAVLRSTSGSQPVEIGKTHVPYFVDTHVVPAAEYQYWIIAYSGQHRFLWREGPIRVHTWRTLQSIEAMYKGRIGFVDGPDGFGFPWALPLGSGLWATAYFADPIGAKHVTIGTRGSLQMKTSLAYADPVHDISIVSTGNSPTELLVGATTARAGQSAVIVADPATPGLLAAAPKTVSLWFWDSWSPGYPRVIHAKRYRVSGLVAIKMTRHNLAQCLANGSACAIDGSPVTNRWGQLLGFAVIRAVPGIHGTSDVSFYMVPWRYVRFDVGLTLNQ